MASKKVAEQKKKEAVKPVSTPMSIMSAFPTNIGLKDWSVEAATKKINKKLRARIYQERGADGDGIYRSNTAGTWHSNTELMQWIGVPELGEMFHNAFASYMLTLGVSKDAEVGLKLQAWAMIYEDRGYATVHTHPNCHFSSVYYLDTPEDNERTMVTGAKTRPGDIEFVDSRAASGYQFPGVNFLPAFRLSPKEGEMIVFPSWLQHFVHPVQGDEDRICIAANATIVSLNTPKKE